MASILPLSICESVFVQNKKKKIKRIVKEKKEFWRNLMIIELNIKAGCKSFDYFWYQIDRMYIGEFRHRF